MTKKKKIGIITTHHYPNYGNKLQNYALQTVLQRMGFDVETIDDARTWKSMNSWKENWKVLLHVLTGFRYVPYHTRVFKFIHFSKRYINYSPIVIRKDSDVNKLKLTYDYFVVGSDQIWNPEWPIFSNAFGFAAFANKEQKVAYAPSLGISEMLPERTDEYRQWLSNWKALSCREYEGAKIIEELSGIRTKVVLDPTLLLTKNEWEILASCPVLKSKYAVLYSLREIDNELMHSIKEDVAHKGLSLFVLGAYDLNNSYGPSEFLSLFKNSDYIYTDSFHGCVFSLLFHRSLTVLHINENEKIKDKISRIITLFENAGITHNNFPQPLNSISNIDWETVDIKLATKRLESIEYLKSNLD